MHGYKSTLLDQEFNRLEQLLDSGGVSVVMIFTAFYLKSVCVYVCWGGVPPMDQHSLWREDIQKQIELVARSPDVT